MILSHSSVQSILLVIYFSFTVSNLNGQDNVTFTYVGQEDFIFCEADSSQTIIITPDQNRVLVELTIIWVVGETDPIIVTDPTQLTHSFIYPVGNLTGCTFDPSCDGLRCFDTRVLALYEDSPNRENLTRTVSFRKAPELTITGGGQTYCVGQTVDLNGQLCPNDDPSAEDLIWVLPNNTTVVNETSINYPLDAPGDYNFNLSNVNGCGPGETSTTITVIDAPTIDAVADSNVVAATATDYRLCFDERATVRLNASASTGLTEQQWFVSPAADIEDQNAAVTRVEFVNPGTYTFRFRGSNSNCGVTEEVSFTIEVIQAREFPQDQQADACISLEYTPSPLYPEVTYVVNGTTVPITDFPLTLGVDQHTILFIPPIDDLCQAPELRDTFEVVAEATAVITTAVDTLCDTEGSFTYAATPATGGIWRINGTTFDGTVAPSTLEGGTYTITYGAEPCILEDQTSLTILSTDITVPENLDLCVDQMPVDFLGQVSPLGGSFSGMGITEAGVFDPGSVGIGVYELTYSFSNVEDPSCGNSRTFQVNVSELAASFETGDCNGDEVCFELPAGVSYDRIEWDFAGLGTSDDRDPCFTFPGEGTYTIQVTVFRGPCETTASGEVNIASTPMPAFSLSSNPDGCSDLLVTLTDESAGGGTLNYRWLLNGEVFSTDPNPGPLTLSSVLQDSIFSISLLLSNACEESLTPESTLITRPKPSARFGTNLDVYCSGDTVRISNNSFGQPDTYRWTLDGSVIGTDSLPPFLAPETEEGIVLELCLLTENECDSSTLCKNLQIVPTDVTALFNATPSRICTGDSLQLTNLSTNGVPVRYDLGDGRFTTLPNPRIVYNSPGVYRISQRAFGCGSKEFVQEITVLDGPLASFNPEVGCPGIPVQFNNSSADTLQSIWDFGDGTALVEDYSPRHIFSTAGEYEVCLTVTQPSPDGCTDTTCRMVTISTPPQASFSVTDSVCLNAPIEVVSLAEGNGLTCRYFFDDGNIAADCNATNTYLLPGAYSITQIVTDQRGCTDTLTLPAFVRQPPVPAFRVETMDACNPDSVRFINETPQADSYLWGFGDGQTSTATSPTHVYTDAGIYLVTLQATIDGICSVTTEQMVTINEMPIAATQQSIQEVCLGESIDFENTSTGTLTSRRWDFGDGTSSFEDNPTGHRYRDTGNYTVTLTVFNEDLCSDSVIVDVTVNPPVLAQTQERRAVECNGDLTGLLTVTTTSGTEPFSYNWSNEENTATITDLAAGVYTVTIEDANGCQTIHQDSITQPPRVRSTATVNRVTCFSGADGSIELAAEGGVSPYAFDWSGGSGDGIISNLAAGDYPITITDANSCSTETVVTVPENDEIIILDSIQQITCFGENDGVFSIRSLSGGVGPYQVSLTGEDYSVEGSTVDRFDGLQPGFYTFSVEDALGCNEAYEIDLREPDEVTLNILEDTVFLSLGEIVVFETRFNAEDSTFAWSPPIELSCTDCPTPTARPLLPLTTYSALLIDGRGCTARDSVTAVVSIDREVYIPNTFTPNADGRNDLFRVRSKFPRGIETIETFQVFDRWGNKMFEQKYFNPNDPIFGWDGRHNGMMVQTGVYVYQAVIRYQDQQTIVLSGEVEVLR